MKINILTLFPDFFQSVFNYSMFKIALEKNKIKLNIINIRDFASDKHHITDDKPFGGGAGMLMKIEPIDLALQSLGQEGGKGQVEQRIILCSAKGKLFNQILARDYAKLKSITLICGHYQGVDERVAMHLVDEEVRIGDYVLTGGETASLIIIETIMRLIPGVLGNESSLDKESHSNIGQFTYPSFTRPEKYRDWSVPEVLLSGNHEEINKWQKAHTLYEKNLAKV